MKHLPKALPHCGIALAFLLCFGARASYAEPTISSVVGEFVDGGQMQISGSSFSQKSNPAPLFFDRVDSVYVHGDSSDPYANVSNLQTVPTGSAPLWASNPNGFMKLVRGSNVYGHRSSIYRGVIDANQWGEYQDAWLALPPGIPAPSANVHQMYMSWEFKPSFDPGSQTGSHKFIRVTDNLGGQLDAGLVLLWDTGALSYSGFDKVGHKSWKDWQGQAGEWNRMELFIDLNAGEIRAWVNGQLIHNVSDLPQGSGYGGIQPRIVGFDGSGAANFSGQHIDLTDFYADSTPARVEVCNAASLAASTRCEVQVPVAWSDSTITILVNEGLLAGSAEKYFYVYNSAGQVNSKGVPACPTCPQPLSIKLY